MSRSRGCDGQDRGTNQRQCRDLLKALMAKPMCGPFCKPVDPIALNIPDYPNIIPNPMDLGTVRDNLRLRVYKSILAFAEDVRLTFRNALTYNPPGHQIHDMAESMMREFETSLVELLTEYVGAVPREENVDKYLDTYPIADPCVKPPVAPTPPTTMTSNNSSSSQLVVMTGGGSSTGGLPPLPPPPDNDHDHDATGTNSNSMTRRGRATRSRSGSSDSLGTPLMVATPSSTPTNAANEGKGGGFGGSSGSSSSKRGTRSSGTHHNGSVGGDGMEDVSSGSGGGSGSHVKGIAFTDMDSSSRGGGGGGLRRMPSSDRESTSGRRRRNSSGCASLGGEDEQSYQHHRMSAVAAVNAMTTTNTNTNTTEENTISAATTTTISTIDHPPSSDVPSWIPLRRAESMESTMSTSSDYYIDNLNNSGHGGR